MIAIHSFRNWFYVKFSYVCMSYFAVWSLRCELRIYLLGLYIFDKFKNTIHELSWSANVNFGNLNFNSKIFVDFNILQILMLKLYLQAWMVFCKEFSVKLSFVYFKPAVKRSNHTPLSLAFHYLSFIQCSSL